MEASERLARLRVGMAGVALANLVLGLAAETAGKGALQALGFDALSAFVWGLLYAAMAAMVRSRPRRILVAAIGIGLIDGLRLVFSAEDAGASPPWLALLLRGGFAALAVAVAFAASQAAQEAAWARRPPPFVAKVGRTAASPRPASVVPQAVRDAAPAASPPVPAPGVRVPRVTNSVLTTGSRAAAVSLRSPSASVDSAAAALRFVVKRCEVTDEGLTGTPPGGSPRLLPWSDVRALWVRMLPPDPPWDSQVLLDVVPASGEPIRVFATTFLHWPEAGRPSSSRLENLRRLAAHVATRVPVLEMDEKTRAFVRDQGPVGQLARFAEVLERDAQYPTGPP